MDDSRSTGIIFIHKDEVPGYLRCSPLFETAFQDDDDVGGHSVEIPADCFKLSPDICNESDLHSLLRTVRFWLIPEYINDNGDLFALALTEKGCMVNQLPEFSENFPILSLLCAATEPSTEFTTMGNAARLGMLSFVRYLEISGHTWDCGPDQHFTLLATEGNHVDCLCYALDKGCALQGNEMFVACQCGYLDCMKCLHEHGRQIVYGDSLLCVAYNRVDCVRYMVEVAGLILPDNTSACDNAATNGNIEMLKYLYSVHSPLTIQTMYCAARHGHLDCLKFAYEACGALGDSLSFGAACNDNMECLQYLVAQGCPLVGTKWTECNDMGGPVWMADRKGVFKCFLYAIEHGAVPVAGMYCLAVHNRSLEFLSYLFERGVEWDPAAASIAAECGNLECLRFLLDRGCPCTAYAYVGAIFGNSLNAIVFLHERGIEWDNMAAQEAVEQNTPAILKYLLQHGCPRDAYRLRATAVNNDFVECVECIDLYA